EPVKFFQTFQYFPWMERFYFDFEKDYSTAKIAYGMKAIPYVPIVISALYLIFCWFGPKVMEGKKPFDLRVALASWNMALSFFSFVGSVKVVPHMLYLLSDIGFDEIVCRNPREAYGCGAAGLWVQAFILSKIPELFDTFFIIVRKKPLIFLHWYHHFSVLLFCWHSYVTESGMGIFFVAMNYSVHAIMYFYYGLVAMRIRTKLLPPWIITIAQISQMVGGVTICCLAYRMRSRPDCDGIIGWNLAAGAAMYGTYLYLFVEFAFKKYVLKQKVDFTGGKQKKQ
ncbi:unnamed protein product, partial [Heterosigma akashiwo]